MISTEKPGSPAELVHFGVKGMQWGVHRTAGTHAFKKANPTSKERSAAIDKARASAEGTRKAYKKEKRGTEERKALKDTHLKNPDVPTALRLKRGEKVVLGLIAFAPSTYLAPAAAGVQVGVIARTGKRRGLEK